MNEDRYIANRESSLYTDFHPNAVQPSYDMLDPGYQMPSTGRRPPEGFAHVYGQNIGEPFDIRTVTWFDDLLGLAPSHSI